jgi:3-oxoacyl-[acyl-carrier protein] reductase
VTRASRRVVVVSGGSRGLGAAIVSQCHEQGWAVATFSRSPSPFITAAERDDNDGRLFWRPVDGRDSTALQEFIAAVSDRFGGIDALVNNAAIGKFGAFPLMRLADIDETIAANLRANIVLTRLITPIMVERGGGAIVNISSVNSIRGNGGVAVYSATKAGLDGFTRALARELGSRNIRVNSLAPGYFTSEMASVLNEAQLRRIVRATPLGRLATVEEIAAAALFLISPAAAFITGQTLVIDGGITC